MKLKINGGDTVIDVVENHLEVKDKRLYNTVTKKYEGIDGDLATFIIKHENGKMYEHRGTVDGYTCSGHIKFRGDDKVYDGVPNIRIDHVSVVTDFEPTVVECSVTFD